MTNFKAFIIDDDKEMRISLVHLLTNANWTVEESATALDVEAKIENFRFHDLRHSAASYLAMNGASLAEIAEVLGHKTLQMVKRYAHLSEAHTAKVVAKMNESIFG